MEFVKLVGPFGVFFIMFALGLNLSIRRFINIFGIQKILLLVLYADYNSSINCSYYNKIATNG